MWRTVGRVLTRKKVLDPVGVQESSLARVLNTYDLTFLGVGSTLGVGMYVLVGHVAKDIAGPAVVLSFLIAAIASAFAGLCYAEFGARAPRAGSAYIYSYVCVGEFVAFVIGWNLILEYVIGSASVARGLSLYLDTLVNNTLKNTFIDIAPMHVPFMSAYFDFLSFGVAFLLSMALAFGMRESSIVNNIFTTVNLGIVIFIVIAGSIYAHPGNWAIDPHNATAKNGTEVGDGYFFPFGIEGMIKGAATCFYGFVGFDCIATTGEEVKNPQKAIPFSIVMSLIIIFLAYMGTSTVVTLMVPYYAQDVNAPITHAFEESGFIIGKWIVAIGAIFGLSISLFGAMFPLPRIIYAMANDGIIFRFLGYVSARFQTPVIGTLLAGILTGLMSALFELKHLVDMMSIGTLLAYTIVAASVMLLRCTPDEPVDYLRINTASESEESDTYNENQTYNNEQGEEMSDDNQLIPPNSISVGLVLKQIFNCGRYENPNRLSEKLVSIEVLLYCVCCIFIGLGALYLQKGYSLQDNIPMIALTTIFAALAVIIIISISLQPKSKRPLYFKVPFVPFIPAISILVNIYLMLMLDPHTWIRFGVWMAVGLPTYFFSVSTITPSTRNKSISSTMGISQNGYINGYANGKYLHEENGKISQTEIQGDDEQVKKNGVLNPDAAVNNESKNIIESADKVLNQLDAILESEIYHDNINIDDKIGDGNCVDTASCHSVNLSVVDQTLDTCVQPCTSNVCKLECVVVDVHHCNTSSPTSPIPDDKNSSNRFPEQNDTITDLKPFDSEPYSDNSRIKDENDDKIQDEESTIVDSKPLESESDNSQIKNENKIEGEEQNIDEPLEKHDQLEIKDDALIEDVRNKNQNEEKDEIPSEQNLVPEVNTEIEDEREPQQSVTDQENVIPIPPPLPKQERPDNINIPRPKIGNRKIKLRIKDINRPSSPPIDYDQKSHKSDLDSPTESPNENLKKGSTQFTRFLQKLERKLQKPPQITYKNSFTSPEKPNVQRKKPIEIPNDSVDDVHIDKGNVKKLLQTLLAKQISDKGNNVDNNSPSDTSFSENISPLGMSPSASDGDLERSVAERSDVDNPLPNRTENNEDNIKDISEGLITQSEDTGSEFESSPLTKHKQELDVNFAGHKKNMDEVIKTLRLRKANSFKEVKE